MSDTITMFLVWIITAYLIGSIPFGLILTRIAGLGDIRKIGSGNIGATNVLRTGRKKLAIATLILDMAKGGVTVSVVEQISGKESAWACAVAVFFGHLYPVWLGFKGGKGVAVFFGILLALSWMLFFVAVGTWLTVAVAFRFSSLAALSATVAVPIAAQVLFRMPQLALLSMMLGVFIFWRHRNNIRQLIDGSEPKINMGNRDVK